MNAYNNNLLDGASLLNLPNSASISCHIIQCGTSRVIVLLDWELPDNEIDTQTYIADLLTGNEKTIGLKGDHYQFNKVAVIYPGTWASEFKFRFFQLDPQTDQLIPNLECANLSTGAGLVALFSKVATLDEFGKIHAENLGTNQKVELTPLDQGSIWSCNWNVRFLMGIEYFHLWNFFIPYNFEYGDNQTIEYWITEMGNVFFLVNLHPDYVFPELVEAITEAGQQQALAIGCNPKKVSLPKVIFYSVETVDTDKATISASCYFKGQKHQSLPGSGSMCLANFLTCSLLMENGVPFDEGLINFHIYHPSGMINVTANWTTYQGNTFISSTEFITPLRLLISGKLAIHQG